MNKIRTIGLYQPFAGLMLCNKIETRVIRLGKKPPFPLGVYVIYATQRQYTDDEVMKVSGKEIFDRIQKYRIGYPNRFLIGKAIAIGELVNVRLMTKADESQCFVLHQGIIRCVKWKNDKVYDEWDAIQWCLEFKNVQHIKPFSFRGKQGVGFLPEDMYEKIN